MMKIFIALFVFVLKLATAAQLQPASVSCNAAYNTPCSRTNAQWLAVTTASAIENYAKPLSAITSKQYNLDTGFYPFVVDGLTSTCVAHGAKPDLVGLTLVQIFDKLNIVYSDASRLHERFLQGGWVQYLWSDQGSVNSKVAYVVPNITLGDNRQYYLGVGYENRQLPSDLPCSDDFDSWCSMTNVRSLVGDAQFRLYQAGESIEAFEATVFDLSFNPNSQIDGGFYTFMYNYNGLLKSHGVIHESLGTSLADIFVDKQLGTFQEGAALHETFRSAVEQQDSAWVQYQWRNSLNEAPYTKIAFLVKIQFEDELYYLGSGFHFATDESPDGPFGESCSADYNLPCAFRTAFQLSSHTLAHAIASPLPPNSRFDAISHDASFREDDFYVFAYDFNGTCVAHGADPSFVGATLAQVFEQVQIPLDAAVLHQQFRTAAQQGGWIIYDWLTTDGVDFKKISYIFKMTLNGNDYYGGVGFNHRPYPAMPYIDMETGTQKNGDLIPCSQDYGSVCSEVNYQSILGQALAELTLASSEVSRGSTRFGDLNDVLVSITDQDESFQVNDFHVAVFAEDGDPDICGEDDGSGCCIAHGSDLALVGMTWQNILEEEDVASIRGADLHLQLIRASNAGGGWIEYPYSKASGAAQTKRAWASRFRSEGKSFYVASEYLNNELPPTCDACPSDMECTRGDQSFCEEKPEPPITENGWFVFLMVLIAVTVPLTILYFWWQKRKWRLKKKALADRMDQLAKRLEQQMQGMVEVVHDLPITSPEEYRRKFGDEAVDSSMRDVAAFWYWEEDKGRIGSHKKEFVLDKTNFVGYSSEISDQIEHAFKLYNEGRGFKELRVDLTDKVISTDTGGKLHGGNSGSYYEVHFERLVQVNSKSKYERTIHREEVEMRIAAEVVGDLPLLPEDIDFSGEADDKEDLLAVFKGQVIQISKVHHSSPQWVFGNVLYDPLMDDALQQNQGVTPAGLNTLLANALHDRPTSGWFPRTVTKAADVNVMHQLLTKLGGEGLDSLTPPSTWDESRGENRINVPKGSREYDEVADYFTAALYGVRDYVEVQKVERIQNMPLWQSYAVKKQTMKTRDAKDFSHRVNNKDPNLEAIERRWLFHGTQPEVISKIEKQGFNRAFAGRNAVAYGKGVYFARDASYASHKTYSVPDSNGVRSMFLCRVVVGDWCKGTNGQLTPDSKPHNNLELFDSTVDNIKNPSIFVIYHDAQAYPEYLVSFKPSMKK